MVKYGDVIEGVASINESAITGESAPVIRAAGSVVSRDDLMNRLYQREATPFDGRVSIAPAHVAPTVSS